MNRTAYRKRRDFWDAMDGLALMLVVVLMLLVTLRHLAHTNSNPPPPNELVP